MNQPTPPAGVYAALATPRRSSSVEADAAVLLDYLDAVTRAGVDGLVLFGSTGEFIHFDLAERMRVLMLAIRRSRVPVLVNVSHSTLAGAMELAEHASGVGAAAVLLMPPYFYRYTGDQIVKFYEDFTKALSGKIAVYLYNLPLQGNPISIQVADYLLACEAFAGIKDSSGEWDYFEALNRLREKRSFQLLIGHESLYARARLAGADGAVSGVAAAIPELLVALERAIRVSDSERVHRLDAHLQTFIHQIERFPATVGIKQAAVARGWPLSHLAVPLDDDTAAELIAFVQWVRSWLPAVLSECSQEAAQSP